MAESGSVTDDAGLSPTHISHQDSPADQEFVSSSSASPERSASSGQESSPLPEPTAPPNASTTVCKWWASGYCARGASCWFSHALPAQASETAPTAVGKDGELITKAEPNPSLNNTMSATAAAFRPSPPQANGEAQSAATEINGAGPSSSAANASPAPGSSAVRIRAPAPMEEQPPCQICFEHPSTYGLLESCSHPFCLACIRSWRQGKEKDPGLIASGVTKACPACRQPSLYITPSSAFHSSGPGKDAVIQRYKDVMAKKPCRHFEASKETSRGPWCPFGDECHYRHALTAGDDRYIFGAGFQEMKRRWMQERSNRIFRRLGGLRHRGQRRRNGVDVDYLDTGGAESLSFDFDAGDFLDGTIPDWDAREDLLDFVDNFGDESLYFNGWDDEYGYHDDLDYYDYTGWDEDDISESRRIRREADADRAEEAFRRAADRILFGPRSSSVRRTGSPLSLDHHQAAGQRASGGAAGEQQSNGHTDAGPARPTASSAAEGRLSSPRSERRRAQRSFNADNRALPRSQQELASRNNINSGGGAGTRTAPRSHRSSARASAAAPNSRGARRQAALADELDDEWEWHDDSEGGDLDADFEEPQVDEDGLQASAGSYQADTEQLEMDAFDVEDDVFGY